MVKLISKNGIQINKLSVSVLNGPAGSGGFRSGFWQVECDGKWFNIFLSLPHSLDLSDQKERLTSAAKKQILLIIAGNPMYHGGRGVALTAPTKAQLYPNSMAAERELK